MIDTKVTHNKNVDRHQDRNMKVDKFVLYRWKGCLESLFEKDEDSVRIIMIVGNNISYNESENCMKF